MYKTLSNSTVIYCALSMMYIFNEFAIAGDTISGGSSSLTTANANNVPAANTIPITGPQGAFLSSEEILQSLTFIGFGIIVLLIEFILLWRANATSEQILKVIGVTLIIIGALLSISSGFNTQQIATAMGLFGTLAGYLLGKNENNNNGEKS
ncbi:hypothetical protein [Raoultella terrigena]|uniref:hypothetical protein n=1 Tax=Raoultella terrigena TaxID=577 RepID=UPI003BAA3383